MLAIEKTLEKIHDLDDNNQAIIINLVDYMSKSQRLSDNVEDARMKNVELLAEILTIQTIEDEDFVSEKVVDNTLRVIFHIIRQPRLFRTFNNSIQMEFELEDRSYMEFEVFEDRMTCMIVPQREYDKASYPEVSLENMNGINQIVGEFYGIA